MVEVDFEKFKVFKKENCRGDGKERKSEKKHEKHHRHSKSKAEKSEKRAEKSKKKAEKKVEEKAEKTEKTEKPEKVEEAPAKLNPKQEEMRAKGKILLTMKQLFGEGNGKEYFQFINEHFALGEEAIIQKWIEKNI